MSTATASRTARTRAGRRRPWDGMVVICGVSNWGELKVHDRNLAEALARHAPVLCVNPPASHLTRFDDPATVELLKRPRLRRVAPRIATFTPLVPPKPMAPAVLPLTNRIVRWQLRRAVQSLGGSVDAVISSWLFVDSFGALEARVRAYWWTDDPGAAAELWRRDRDRLVAADERMTRSADVVLAVSAEQAARLRERGVDARHLPNGCDASSYLAVDDAPAPPDVDLPGPIAGFVGHLNERTDLALLEGVADAGVSLLVIGPHEESFEPARVAALAARPNVRCPGPRPFADLPSYLSRIDVGLVPYADTDFNRRSFPLKLLEYLAGGRPVVSTPLPAARWLATDQIELATTPTEFAAAVRRALPGARDRQLVAARRRLAAEHSWSARAEAVVEMLGIESRPLEVDADE